MILPKARSLKNGHLKHRITPFTPDIRLRLISIAKVFGGINTALRLTSIVEELLMQRNTFINTTAIRSIARIRNVYKDIKAKLI
jgi:hypothetical protein